jgi:predicted aldo/keto reductase-like oxidoreductase
MQYRTYGKTGWKTSLLGLGCMRFPGVQGNADQVDREKAIELIHYAADNGVNYFDSAWAYHGGESESIVGEALEAGGRRERVYIATKQPINVMETRQSIRANLETSLKKLRSSYIDSYLMHSVTESTWGDFLAKGALEEFAAFKAEGLVRAVGFSYHGGFAGFKKTLDAYDWDMCQLQENFMDVEKETTPEGIYEAGRKGCALVIMEPLRGGSLAAPPPQVRALYDARGPKRPPVEWAFRYIANFSEPSVILSGMSTLDQLKENIALFSRPDFGAGHFSKDDNDFLGRVKAAYEAIKTVPCTGCNYCIPCPRGVNIPEVFRKYNDGTMFNSFGGPRWGYGFMKQKGEDAGRCTACGACEKKCPQRIGIREALAAAHKALA